MLHSRVGFWLTYKHLTRLEILKRDNYLSLLRIVVDCVHKKFYNIEPRAQCYIAFYVYKVRSFRNKIVFVPYDVGKACMNKHSSLLRIFVN